MIEISWKTWRAFALALALVTNGELPPDSDSLTWVSATTQNRKMGAFRASLVRTFNVFPTSFGLIPCRSSRRYNRLFYVLRHCQRSGLSDTPFIPISFVATHQSAHNFDIYPILITYRIATQSTRANQITRNQRIQRTQSGTRTLKPEITLTQRRARVITERSGADSRPSGSRWQ